jgi:anaerobic dimethyl sulfoxide reductase subunit B
VVRQYAFFVNADACSGCRTCQVACNDANGIRVGLHWRRVYEVSSGDWTQRAGVWTNTVASYYLSLSCLHCRTPLCALQCPSDAIDKRPDGIVLIDDGRCTRCRKCENDCPYGAIRWDGEARAVRKCTFCVEEIDAGRPPVCVAACPNRALAFGEFDDLTNRYPGERRVFPLPDASAAGPAVVIRPHRRTADIQSRHPEVANWEEL